MKSSRLVTVWRICQAGTRNFFRNAWLSMAAIAVMTVMLTVILNAFIINVALNDTLADVTKKIDIAVFFKEGVTAEQVLPLQEDIKRDSNITSVFYVSKTEALKRYREQNKNSPELLEAVNEQENPLPTSLEIQVKDLKRIDPLIETTRKPEYSQIVSDTSLGEDRQKTVQRIANVKAFLLKAGVVASAIFATIAVLIIFNTIRMAIFSRGEEISIMRLVGATNGYIRGPFLFESMLDGVIAGVITLVITYVVLFIGAPKLLSYVNFSQTITLFETYWTLVGLATLLLGMLVGVASSALAMVRYLKL
jgi:cell division transport system permease protein